MNFNRKSPIKVRKSQIKVRKSNKKSMMGGVTEDILSFNISLKNSGNNEDNILKYDNFDFEVKKKNGKTNIIKLILMVLLYILKTILFLVVYYF